MNVTSGAEDSDTSRMRRAMVEDEGLAGDLHRMLDERNLGRVKRGRIIIRQRVRDVVDNLISERVGLESRVNSLMDINQRQHKNLDDYLGLVQAAYDYDAETGEWHLKNLSKPTPAIPITEGPRKLDLDA